MMAGELHEISLAIGNLQAHADEHQRQNTALFTEIKDINAKLAVLIGLKDTVVGLEPLVAKLEKDRIERNARVTWISGGSGFGVAALFEGIVQLGRSRGWWS